MADINFEQLKELDIKKVQEFEKEFPKIQDNTRWKKKEVDSSYGKHLETQSTNRGRQISRTMPVGVDNHSAENLPICGFKLTYSKAKENYAEELVEGLKDE